TINKAIVPGSGMPEKSSIAISDLTYAEIYLSGPTSNYQRVIANPGNFLTASVRNADGTYTYTLPAIPATYLAPPNDSASFGTTDGEKQGQAIENGTYTIGIAAYKNYTVGTETVRDVVNVTTNIVIGAAGTAREVVKSDNCNRCHVTLQVHDNFRRDVKLCVLCHVSGAEDANDATVEGGTPGVSADFRVMIHKLHNGGHLPSVLGVSTALAGTRDYAATAAPYKLVGSVNGVNTAHDFSEASFPIMPSAYIAHLYDSAGTTYSGVGGIGVMPKDTGFSLLTSPQKLQEDRIRSGMVACDKCHGDPDGAGSLTAPAQESLSRIPSRRACGSCHDDVVWSRPYTSNTLTMPAGQADATCATCHPASNSTAWSTTNLPVVETHTHPFNNTTFNTGVSVSVGAVGGGTGAGGKHQAGDPIQPTFSVKNTAGTDIQIHQLTRLQMIVTGPTSNTQFILPNVNTYDFAFRKATPFTGTGSINTPTIDDATAVKQVFAIVFTAANTFDVIGSVSGTLASGLVVPDGGGNTGNLTYAGVTFKITDGGTNFVAHDRWYMEIVPKAVAYTEYVPFDITYERVGAATGGADVFTVANLPLYWGRQVVYERTAITAWTVADLNAVSATQDRYVVADSADLATDAIIVGDKVVIDAGTASEEYLVVGRIQTTDDSTGADLGANDQLWFSTALRFSHLVGAKIQEVTLSSRREGTQYTVTDAANGQITLVAGQFTATNPVLVSYRTYGRFGWKRGPGDATQTTYQAAFFESGDFDLTWGSWRNLAIADGTYTVGFWANKDYTVTPAMALTTTEGWNNFTSENTTYRMMALPATKQFLYGAATTLTSRSIISSNENCNDCHGDLMFHGFGRRGLDTCLLCHTQSGAEDAAKYAYNSWYIGVTDGVTVDFRGLIHKIHMGRELTNASTYVANGVFLGTPYPLGVAEIEFPPLPGGPKHCDKCHGSGSTSWKEPASRNHPTQQTVPLRKWRGVCISCHDSTDASAHMDLNTSGGNEACGACHGDGAENSVELKHKNR
ncbi:MAG: hypothetical protein HYY93_10455, partial [Planctomycetes bacterium]|nr:hypothetical protein [Planctomycetota bacterium]